MAKKQRSSYTVLSFCPVCGVEVYRRPGVKQRRAITLSQIEQGCRMGQWKHHNRTGHQGYWGTLWINEVFGDAKLEVPGQGEAKGQGQSALDRLQDLGLLPKG